MPSTLLQSCYGHHERSINYNQRYDQFQSELQLYDSAMIIYSATNSYDLYYGEWRHYGLFAAIFGTYNQSTARKVSE